MRMSYNEYLFKKVAISTLLGLFVAKIIAIWCKTQCVLVLNAMRFDTKCSAFWCKTQGKMVLNAVQNDAKRKSKRINIR